VIRSAVFTLMSCSLAFGSTFASTTATTHYIAANGLDTNNGTSESAPWAHLPGMATCTNNCVSYAPLAGDTFILRGCDVWPNASFPIHWKWSGTSSSQITIGVDKSWYNATNCPTTWNRPIFDAGGTNIGGAGCGGLGANWFVYLDHVTYVIWNWIEARGLYWNNDQQNRCYHTVGNLIGNGTDYVVVSNWYFHGWTHGLSAGTSDVGGAGMIMTTYNTTPSCTNCLVTNSVIDNSDSVDGATCVTDHSLCSGGDIGVSATNNVIRNVVEAFLTGIPSGTSMTWAGNNIYNINLSFTNPTQSSPPHPNCIETVAGGTFYIHDNYIHDVPGCEGGQIGNGGETDYVWNNIWVMNGVAGSNGPQVPQSSPAGSLYFFNNTVVNSVACINQAGHGGSYAGSFEIHNNHCINSSATVINGSFSAGGTFSTTNNVAITQATAAAQGYVNSGAFVYSPQNNNCNSIPTNCPIGVGLNLVSLWPSGFSTNDTSYACTEQTVSGVVESVCPARSSNTRLVGSAVWDIGAYTWGTSSASVPNPPTGLLARVQ
jgi:hypothetical protein